MKYCRGKYILMLDADGATEISEYDRLFNELETIKNSKEEGYVVGSRNAVSEAKIAEVFYFFLYFKRKIHRKLLMWVNNFLVHTAIGIHNIKDTQCGFKLFTRKTAHRIFKLIHLNRWAFDVEMIYIGKHLNIPVREVSVNWREVEGSKLNVLAASISFIRDYLSILAFYTSGIWKISA